MMLGKIYTQKQEAALSESWSIKFGELQFDTTSVKFPVIQQQSTCHFYRMKFLLHIAALASLTCQVIGGPLSLQQRAPSAANFTDYVYVYVSLLYLMTSIQTTLAADISMVQSSLASFILTASRSIWQLATIMIPGHGRH